MASFQHGNNPPLLCQAMKRSALRTVFIVYTSILAGYCILVCGCYTRHTLHSSPISKTHVLHVVNVRIDGVECDMCDASVHRTLLSVPWVHGVHTTIRCDDDEYALYTIMIASDFVIDNVYTSLEAVIAREGFKLSPDTTCGE